MVMTLPIALFEQAKRRATKDQPVLLSYVTELTTELNPLQLYQKAGQAFFGERFFWQNPEMTLTLAGFGVTEQFLADRTKEAFSGLENRLHLLKERTVTNATLKETGALYFGGFAFDPIRDRDKEWQSFKDGLFYLPLFMVTKKGNKQFLTINIAIYQDDELNKVEAVFAQWLKILETEFENQKINSLVSTKELDRESFLQATEDAISFINSSADLHKVVLSRRMGLRFSRQVDSGLIIQEMLATQENSYFFAMEKGSAVFFGATPERLLAVRDDVMYSSCVAGSIKRGQTEAEDEELGRELLQDAKNLQEHHYVVQMIEQTLAPFAENLTLSSEPVLLKNRDIQHLYMNVSAKKRPETNMLNVIQALHPTPALGGLPQKQALAIIRMKEQSDRGFYGAPIGFIDTDFEGEFAVAIRSGLVVDSVGVLYAGCGIVRDSNPLTELEETAIKFQPMLRVLGGLKE